MTANAIPTPTNWPIQFGQRDAKVIESATKAAGTISNKTIDSSNTIAASLAAASIKTSCSIVDSTNVTKTLKFNLSGATAGADLTVSSAQTANRTLTIPVMSGNDTMMTLGLAQTVTGVVTFNAAPVISSITNEAATITLPSATGTLATLAGSEALSGKTYEGLSVSSGTSTFSFTKGSSVLSHTGAFTTALTASASTALALPGSSGTLALVSDIGSAITAVANVSLTTTQIKGMGTTPIQLVAAPASGHAIVVDEVELYHVGAGKTQYASGGVVQVQYANTANNGGTAICASADATVVTAASTTWTKWKPALASTGFNVGAVAATGVFISAAADFTTGEATNIVKVRVLYRDITLQT